MKPHDLPIKRLGRLWSALIRVLIGLLVIGAGTGLYLGLNPGALQALVVRLPLPGVADIPTPGPTPQPPSITAAQGALPAGPLSFFGRYAGGSFSCGFLLDLGSGLHVGISAAHATALLPPGTPAELIAADGSRMAGLMGQVGRGQPFQQNRFTLDYVLWSVAENTDAALFLRPDPRGAGQPGERVWVLAQAATGGGEAYRRPGVVMSAGPEAIWVQMDDAFEPGGLSGCPVVSQYTGQLIGMAVAGANKSPTVLGLHPAASLVEKARAALLKP